MSAMFRLTFNLPLKMSRLGLAAILLGFWLCGQETCQASCGDYLLHRDVATPSNLRPDDGPEAPKGPCRGANCSRRSDSPLLPTRPTVETTSVEWLCVMDQIRDQYDESNRWSLESEAVLPLHTSQPPDHPPRG